MDEHQHDFKTTKIDISNGQKFITEKCACGASKGSSKSPKEKSKFHKTFGVIEHKPAPEKPE